MFSYILVVSTGYILLISVCPMVNIYYLFSLYLTLTFPSLQIKPINVN